MRLFRAYVERWAYDPLSGEGGAQLGGRWNSVGMPCWHAACDAATAWAEFRQGFVQHPAILIQFMLEGARLADISNSVGLDALGLTGAVNRCEWRRVLDEGAVPETHDLARRLVRKGYHGLIYPSTMSPGGRAVALWRWNRRGAPRLAVVDQEQRVPKHPAAWL